MKNIEKMVQVMPAISNAVQMFNSAMASIQEANALLTTFKNETNLSMDDILTVIHILSPEDEAVIKRFLEITNNDTKSIVTAPVVKTDVVVPKEESVVEESTVEESVTEEPAVEELHMEELPAIKEEKKTSEPPKDVLDSIVPEDAVAVWLPRYPYTIYVDTSGNIYVNNEKLVPDIGYDAKAYVDLPTPSGNVYRQTQKKLVGLAFLPENNNARDLIVHKNGNPCDCRPCNLAYRSTLPDYKNDPIDESDAHDICAALIVNYFNEEAAIRWLAIHKKKAYHTIVTRVHQKERFKNISDLYFNENDEIRKIPEEIINKVDQSKLKFEVQDDDTSYKQTIREVDLGLKIASFFNRYKITPSLEDGYKKFKYECDPYFVANNKPGGLNTEDVKWLIKYAASQNVDIKATLRRKCRIIVDDKTIITATR